MTLVIQQKAHALFEFYVSAPFLHVLCLCLWGNLLNYYKTLESICVKT